MPTPATSLRELATSDEVWARDLAHIQTSYGCLVYLAALRNPDTGRYEHYGSSSAARLQTGRTLKRVHEEIFKEWVSHPLERKKADVELYISGIDQVGRAELIDAWLRLTPYKNLVPASIQGPERQKHISDFEAILRSPQECVWRRFPESKRIATATTWPTTSASPG